MGRKPSLGHASAAALPAASPAPGEDEEALKSKGMQGRRRSLLAPAHGLSRSRSMVLPSRARRHSAALLQTLPAMRFAHKAALQRKEQEPQRGEPEDRALMSAPVSSASPTGSSHEDVSPSIFMLQSMRQARGPAQYCSEGEEEAQPSQEHCSWMAATLASLPGKRRDTLPPLNDKPRPLLPIVGHAKRAATAAPRPS